MSLILPWGDCVLKFEVIKINLSDEALKEESSYAYYSRTPHLYSWGLT